MATSTLGPLAPLSYAADLIHVGLGGAPCFGGALDVGALVLFTATFLTLARFTPRWTQG